MSEKQKEKYFDETTDSAIIEFISEKSPAKRSRTFEKKIMPAFTKLAQYHYNKFPISKNPEVIQDCVVDLYEKLHKFNPEKSSRGFPYFNMIAKNFFIQKLKAEKKEVLTNNEMIISLNDSSNLENENLSMEPFERDVENKQFILLFKSSLNTWCEKASKDHEKMVVEAVISLFQNTENIDLFNDKAIMFYIKEMTGLNSKQIKSNLSKIKKKFIKLKSKYNRGDF